MRHPAGKTNNDVDNMFVSTKWVLMGSALWTLDVEEKYRIPYKIYQAWIRFAYSYAIFAIFMKFISYVGIKNERALESLSININNICLASKIIMCSNKRMSGLLATAIADTNEIMIKENQEIKNIFSKYTKPIKNFNIFMVVYTFLLMTDVTAYSAFVEYPHFLKTHPNATEERIDLLVLWCPFDEQKHFDLARYLQMFILYNCAVNNFSTLAFLNTMMTYIVAKLQSLQYCFKHFDHQWGEIDPVEGLRRCVIKHQEIIKFIQDLNYYMKFVLLIEYSVSSLMIASVFLQALRGNMPEMYVPYGTVLTFQLCILSWRAGELSIESEKVSLAVYESNWPHLDPKLRKAMSIIMMRSRRVLSLDIGPFGPNNIQVAGATFKLAYSYLSLMSGVGSSSSSSE